jgi:hypothetical protein
MILEYVKWSGFVGLLMACAVARAAPIPAQANARWGYESAGPARQHIDHHIWDGILKRYRVVGEDGIARLRYSAVSAADRADLTGYLAQLGSIQPAGWPKAEQLALWTNLYNATLVAQILQSLQSGTPRPTIDEIRPDKRQGRQLFDAKLIGIDGEVLSLNDIRDRILRPLYRDPLVIYLLACGSLGCPDLPAEAATAANVQRLMLANAAAFINSPRLGVVRDGRLRLSQFYDWFGADFGDAAGLAAHLQRFAEPAAAARLSGLPAEPDSQFDNRLNLAP